MESKVTAQLPVRAQTTFKPSAHASDSRSRKRLLICTLAIGMGFVAIIGVIRHFQSLNDGTISPWRLAVLFANVFGCVVIVCALYRRGRDRSRSSAARRFRV
jgi:hypothetical protein